MPRRPVTAPTARPITLAAHNPNAGLAAAYRRKLAALLDEMHASVAYFILAAYRRTPPLFAADAASPAAALAAEMAELGARWTDRFDRAAPEIADWFATAAKDRSDFALAASLRRAGMTVKFAMSPLVRDVMHASVAENVRVIKTIPAEYLGRVESAVLRSVTAGRDVGALARELSHGYGVSKVRARLIATHQNNMATATITRVRQTELGISQAYWLHSGGGNHPRPEHVAMSGKKYDVLRGAFLEGEWVWPGTAINCRCVTRSIVPGLD